MTDLERFFRRLVGTLASTDPARLHRPLALSDVEHDILPYRANRRALALESSEDYEMILLRLCAGEGDLVHAEPEEARARFAREAGASNPDLSVLRAFDNVWLTLRSEPLARALGPGPEADYAPVREGPAHSALPELVLYDPADDPTVEMAIPGAVDEDAVVDDDSAVDDDPAVVHDEAVDYRAAMEADEAEHADDAVYGGVPEARDEAEVADRGPDAPAERPAVGGAAPRCAHCGAGLPAHRAVNFCPHCGRSQTVPECARCGTELEPGWKHCVNCGAAVGRE